MVGPRVQRACLQGIDGDEQKGSKRCSRCDPDGLVGCRWEKVMTGSKGGGGVAEDDGK